MIPSSIPAPFFQASAARLVEALHEHTPLPTRLLVLSHDDSATLHHLQHATPQAQVTEWPHTPTLTPQSQHALLSNLTLGQSPNPQAFLHHSLSFLAPDSLVLATTLGHESFTEFRALGLHPTPLPTLQQAAHWLTSLHLINPVALSETITLTFPNLTEALTQANLHHLTGVRHTPSRNLSRLETRWKTLFSRPDGRLPLTIQLITLSARTPKAIQGATSRNLSILPPS